MKTSRSLVSCLVPSAGVRAGLLLVSALFALSATSRAQTIFVADPNGSNGVSSYNINGTLINASLINLSGASPTSFEGLALSGSTLYVAKSGSGQKSIGAYTLNGTGGVSSSSTIITGGGGTGLNNPYGLAVTATNVFIADFNSGNVFKYDFSGNQLGNVSAGTTNPYGLAVSGNILWVSEATTGTGINTINGYNISTYSNTPLFTITSASGLNLPHGLAVSGNTLFVANGGAGNILSFDATTGASNGAAVVTGLTDPQGITVYGSSLFVTGSDGTIKGFDTSAGYGALAGFTTVTGLSSPYGIVVSAIPEPSTYAAIAGAMMLGFAGWRRRNRKNSPAVAPANATV